MKCISSNILREKEQRPAVMEHQVPEPVKKERSNILLALEKKMSEEFREYYVGKQVTALIGRGL